MKLVCTQVKNTLADLAIERRRTNVCTCGHKHYAHIPLGGPCKRCSYMEFWEVEK